MSQRTPLNLARILDAAVVVADAGGLAAVSMRNVGRELGVEAMSLYHHVANKDRLLDELADWIFTGIELPELTDPWREAMIARAESARRVFAQHPWALHLIESRRAAGPALLQHHDTVLGNLRSNGFPLPLAMSAFSAIDSYVYGFALTESNLPIAAEEASASFASEFDLEPYPFLTEMLTAGDFTFGGEFLTGLGMILDELQARHPGV